MKCIVGKLYQRDPHPSCLQGKIFISITVRVNLIIKETFSPWHLGIPDAARWWRKFALYLDLNHSCLFLHVCPTYPVFGCSLMSAFFPRYETRNWILKHKGKPQREACFLYRITTSYRFYQDTCQELSSCPTEDARTWAYLATAYHQDTDMRNHGLLCGASSR